MRTKERMRQEESAYILIALCTIVLLAMNIRPLQKILYIHLHSTKRRRNSFLAIFLSHIIIIFMYRTEKKILIKFDVLDCLGEGQNFEQ